MSSGPLFSRGALTDHSNSIVIGLVNNMPDAALRITEHQFHELLSAATRDFAVCLRLFSLTEVPRGDAGRAHLNQHYEDLAELWSSNLDGLIVTGAEPKAPELTREPYWCSLAKLIDWADQHTNSTIWSCLAAHAAVLHRDGIKRHRIGEKLCGIFGCDKSEDHAILSGVPLRWLAPHSRHNGLSEQALSFGKYRILSRSPEAGVDMFMKEGRSLFAASKVIPNTIRVRCCANTDGTSGGSSLAPQMFIPGCHRGCSMTGASTALSALRQRALRERHRDVLAEITSVISTVTPAHVWREAAIGIYSNWLSSLADRKRRGAPASFAAGLREPVHAAPVEADGSSAGPRD